MSIYVYVVKYFESIGIYLKLFILNDSSTHIFYLNLNTIVRKKDLKSDTFYYCTELCVFCNVFIDTHILIFNKLFY